MEIRYAMPWTGGVLIESCYKNITWDALVDGRICGHVMHRGWLDGSFVDFWGRLKLMGMNMAVLAFIGGVSVSGFRIILCSVRSGRER